MKTAIVLIASCALLTGCASVPYGQYSHTCRLLETAFEEAEMSTGWYESSGAVLEFCGVRDAKERVKWKVCYATTDGYAEALACSKASP